MLSLYEAPFQEGILGTSPLFSIECGRVASKWLLPAGRALEHDFAVRKGILVATALPGAVQTLSYIGKASMVHSATSARAKPAARKILEPEKFVVAFPSALGWMAAVFHGGALARLAFGYQSRREALAALDEVKVSAARELDSTIDQVIARLQAFAVGNDDDFADLAVDYGRVTPFQRRVLDACRGVGPGETLSYGQLAQLAGSPGAARAVGSVMSHNRLPLVVPCHRIVGSSGALGGYSAPEGLDMKRKLLAREGTLV
jgi:methylated-DNA-[protein]-cysteine S-methyltransferase